MSFYIRQFLPYLAVSAVVYLPFRLRKKRSSLIPDLIFFVYIVALLMLTVLPMVFVAQHGLLVRLPCADVLLGLGKIETIPQPSERSLQLQPFATVIGLLTDDALPQRVRLLSCRRQHSRQSGAAHAVRLPVPAQKRRGTWQNLRRRLAAVLGIEIIQYFEGPCRRYRRRYFEFCRHTARIRGLLHFYKNKSPRPLTKGASEGLNHSVISAKRSISLCNFTMTALFQ